MTETEWLACEDPAKMLMEFRPAITTGTGMFADLSDRKLRLFACACCRRVWHLLADPRSRRAVEVAERYADGQATERELIEAQEAAGDAHDLGPDDETSVPTYDAWACADPDAADAVRMLTQADPPPSGRAAAAQAALLREVVGNPFRPVGPVRHSVETPDSGPSSRRWADPAWLTPQALSLAQAGHDERGGVCPACDGYRLKETGVASTYDHVKQQWVACPACGGTGRDGSGTLDPARLAVLADALEEAGCADVECGVCKGKGTVIVPGPYDTDQRGQGYWRQDVEMCEECGGDPLASEPGTGRLPHPLLSHLRSPGPHVRGCWALDLVLGKE